MLLHLQHVLRQLPSSPVPASCCTALLEAYSKFLFLNMESMFLLWRLCVSNSLLTFFLKEIDHKETRVKSLRSAITETFPEPNRRLLLRYAFRCCF